MKHIIILLLIILSLNKISFSQWEPVNETFNSGHTSAGIIYCLGVKGKILFAGTNDGYVFRSTDEGARWYKLHNLPIFNRANCFSIQDTDIYMGTDVGIFHSADFGDNWVKIYPYSVHTISIIDTNIYAIHSQTFVDGTGSGSMIGFSTNKGSSWKTIYTGLDSTIYLYPLVNLRNKIFVGMSNWMNNYSGVLISTNNGTSWTLSNDGLPKGGTINYLAISGNNIIAGNDGENPGLYYSTNEGISWNISNLTGEIPYGYSPNILTPFRLGASETNNIVAEITYHFKGGNTAGESDLVKSTDNGITWQIIHTTDENLGSFFLFSGSKLYSGYKSVYVSTNYGLNWTSLKYGLSSHYISSMLTIGNNIYVGFDRLFNSNDQGQSWHEFEGNGDGTPDPRAGINTIKLNDKNIYVGTYNGVYFSSDEGLYWTKITADLSNIYSLAFSKKNIFAGNTEGVHKSTNNGISWAPISLNENVNSLVVIDTNIFAGTSNGVFLSTDEGEAWKEVNNGLPSYNRIYCLGVSGKNIFAGTYFGVYISTNNGLDWISSNNGFDKADSLIESISVVDSRIFAGVLNRHFGGSIYLSTDNGLNWTNISNGLDYTPGVTSIVISGDNMFAATEDYGVWTRPLSELTSTEKREVKKTLPYILYQNYPNPFNPMTKIKFEIKSSKFVSIKIYDILGKEVTTLINKEFEPGIYEETWDAKNFSSGIYFYQFKTVNFVETKKIILLK